MPGRCLLLLLFFKSAATAAAFHAGPGQDAVQRAELGETALEQVQAHECGEEQKVRADEQRAGLHAQRQRQHDKSSCDDTDDTFCVHYYSPVKKLWLGLLLVQRG